MWGYDRIFTDSERQSPGTGKKVGKETDPDDIELESVVLP